jgi:hypothetical protein
MCEMCKRRDALIERLPTELRKFMERGALGNMRAPSPDKLKVIMDAGPGEHQDRLWRLAVKESKEATDKDLDFMLEKHSVELKAIEGEASALVSELLKGNLHTNHNPNDKPPETLVN